MKIGLLTQEYHLGENRFGGVGRAFGKMAHWLAEHGHEVTVYYQARQAEEIEERPNLRVVTVTPKPLLHWRIRPLIRRLPAFWGGLIWHWEVNTALTVRIMDDYRSGKIEVLLASRGVTAPELIIRRKMPTIVRMQYSLIQKQRVEQLPISWLDRYHDRIEHWAIRRATGVYAPCKFTVDYAASFTSREIEVIRTPMFEVQPAVDWAVLQARYHLPVKYFLFWGGMVRVKGIHVLAEALPLVFERDAAARVVIVGSRRYTLPGNGTTADPILALQRRYPDRLILLPTLDPPELFAVIKQADVAVLPSVMDNLPNTLLEAMHFGKVIVASHGASLDELITHEETGLLFPLSDSSALAEMMLRASRMQVAERDTLAQSAKHRVHDQCSPDVVMPNFLSLCAEAVAIFNAQGRATLPAP